MEAARKKSRASTGAAAAGLSHGFSNGSCSVCRCRGLARSSPSPLLAVARPLLRGARLGALAESEDGDESNIEFELHWPKGPPDGHGEQRVYAATLRKGERFCKAKASEISKVQAAWQAARSGSSHRWHEEHVLTGSILSTWAVLGTAIGASQSSKAPRKIPLVRAKLVDGGAVVGVRVQPERLQEVRYVLAALCEERSRKNASQAAAQGPSEPQASERPQPSELSAPDIARLSAQLEAFLRTQPGQSATWHGWAGAHKVLAADGLVSEGAPGMLSAQEAMDDLERNGKIDVDTETGQVHLREKPKGSGWYIPPPKKPKTGRGRGRRGGRGR